MDYFHFKNAIILQVSGKDSERYLHARLSNNIKALKIGQSFQAACLSSQGKTQAFFQVAKLADAQYLLLCSGGDAQQVLAALKKFIVADRVEVLDLSNSHTAIHLISSQLQNVNNLIICQMPIDRIGQAGLDLIVKNENFELLKNQISLTNEIASEDFELSRIKFGAPSFDQELNEKYLFSECGLSQAISFNKGCYVGQEVVEKIDAYGKAPKILRKICVAGKLEKTEKNPKISLNSENIGEILSFAYDPKDGKTYAFARIDNEQELLQSEKLSVNGLESYIN